MEQVWGGGGCSGGPKLSFEYIKLSIRHSSEDVKE